MDQWLFDLKLGVRGLRRSPAFAIAAVTTLGLGIGAAISVFSVVNTVLLKSLPYAAADQLVVISTERRQTTTSWSGMGLANVHDVLGSLPALGSRFAYDGTSGVIRLDSGESWRASCDLVSADFTAVLGVSPMLGRSFSSREVETGRMVALISYGCWKNRFGGRSDIIGQRIVMNEIPAQVIGVMPEPFYFNGRNTQFWLPWTTARDWAQERQERGTGPWTIVARLAEDSSIDLAQRQADVLAQTLETDFPANRGLRLRVIPLARFVTRAPVRDALVLLGISVGALLLIACSNVGNLLLIRGIARAQEFHVRAALGATRSRIVRQLCTEGVVFSLASTALGLLLAFAAVALIRRFGPTNVPRLDEIAVDWWSIAFAFGLAVIGSVLFGVLPALRMNEGADAAAALRSGRGESASRTAGRARALLVVVQFALAVALFTSATVLGRSLQRILQVDPGFRAEEVLVAGMTLPGARSDAAAARYAQQALARVAALPGVISAGVVENLQLNERAGTVAPIATIPPIGPEPLRSLSRVEAVSGDFFTTLRVPLKSGRFFDDRDGAEAPPVAIINDTLAQELWRNEDPVGRKLRVGADSPWFTIVGVVRSMRRQSLEREPLTEIFIPYKQQPFRNVTIVVRTSQDLSGFAPSLRNALVEVDPGVPVGSVAPLSQEMKDRLAVREFNLGLMTSFTLVALVLAGVGIYGTMNYAVVQRRKEIGIRMALGADPTSMLLLVLRQGLLLALIGMGVGTLIAAAVTRSLGSMLYAVGPWDVMSFLAANAVLLAIAMVACVLPARNASSVDPSVVLRAE